MLVRIATTSRKPGASSTPPAPARAADPRSPSPGHLAAHRLHRRLGSESGFTLIEVLIVSALLTAVLGATLAPFEFEQKQTTKNIEYTKAVSEASTGLQNMMREVRQAYRINETTSNSIRFNAIINSSDVEVFYECDLSYPSNAGNAHYKEYRRCGRVSAETGKTLPSLSSKCPAVAPKPETCPVVIDRLLNGTSSAPVFRFKDASGAVEPIHPSYVEAVVRVPSRGSLNEGLSHSIELSNGTAIPNLLLR
jgi:prepilin-type N-terminal cleavage/methylation domain-containing protein